MKLSDAMIAGSLELTHIRRMPFAANAQGDIVAACALGMAVVSAARQKRLSIGKGWHLIRVWFPLLTLRVPVCPVCTRDFSAGIPDFADGSITPVLLAHMVVHWNDDHQLPMPEIVALVEELERSVANQEQPISICETQVANEPEPVSA